MSQHVVIFTVKITCDMHLINMYTTRILNQQRVDIILAHYSTELKVRHSNKGEQ